MNTHWTYAFLNRLRRVTFGPYPNEKEAKEAFQRVYGYWPEDAIDSWPYLSESE